MSAFGLWEKTESPREKVGTKPKTYFYKVTVLSTVAIKKPNKLERIPKVVIYDNLYLLRDINDNPAF